MAYSGTTPTVFIRMCEQWSASTGPLDCAWVEVSRSVMDTVGWDVYSLDQLFLAIILLVALIFIISALKKAIEQ
jgi:hypothetical protein